MSSNKYQKLKIALTYYLVGAGYHDALRALAYAESLSAGGFRKDNITKEFQHQLEMALYITTLKGLVNEQRFIIAALLHDVREDYGIEHEYFVAHYGADTALDVGLMTKKFKGIEKDKATFFKDLLKSPVASLGKGVDRINNIQSMSGVFTLEKQIFYIQEVEEYFLPMLKKAAQLYPEMFLAFMNIRTMLKNQCALIKKAMDGSQFAPSPQYAIVVDHESE